MPDSARNPSRPGPRSRPGDRGGLPALGFPARHPFRGSVLTSLGKNEIDVIELTATDYTRAAQLVTQYADLPLGAVDACVIALAERLQIQEIATLDRRHFTVVRPAHTDAFTLLPERSS